METVEHIKQICKETGNDWFFTHDFTKIAIYDLILKENLLKQESIDIDEIKCTCSTEDSCLYCEIQLERHIDLDTFNLSKSQNNIYDFEKSEYIKTHWITHSIDGIIQGFILLECDGNEFENDGFTTELIFACVRPSYRNKGILHSMVNKIPKGMNVWLEADSNEIENIERVWERCGFSFHTKLHDQHLIYTKHM